MGSRSTHWDSTCRMMVSLTGFRQSLGRNKFAIRSVRVKRSSGAPIFKDLKCKQGDKTLEMMCGLGQNVFQGES